MSAFTYQRALFTVWLEKNGAGKTTLMRIICGLTQQSAGNYTLLGKSNDDSARNRMGILIEKPGIYEHMTATENLRYFSLLFGFLLLIMTKF